MFADDNLPAVISLLIPVVALLIPIVAIVAGSWRRAKVAEYRAVVVQNMLDKGFNADEVERVLRASDAGVDKLSGKRSRRHPDYAR